MEAPENRGPRWLEGIRGDHARRLIESDERVIKDGDEYMFARLTA